MRWRRRPRWSRSGPGAIARAQPACDPIDSARGPTCTDGWLLATRGPNAWRTSTRHSPRLSIGLPVYNGERYLAEAFDCFLAQTFQDFEIIVCDNASTDHTAEICRSYAERDPRIRYYRNGKNLGAIPNFNRVFELSRSPLFKWAAHDDLYHPRYMETCIRILDDILTSSWLTPRRRLWTIAASLSLSIQRRETTRSPNRRCPKHRTAQW